jgi:hypothetical protein
MAADGYIGEFTDHYTIVGDAKIQPFLEDAMRVADGDKDRIWFIRHGDGCDCEPVNGDDEDFECECEETWDVELLDGQYVNRVGYFVTTEPCRPEHRSELFTY